MKSRLLSFCKIFAACVSALLFAASCGGEAENEPTAGSTNAEVAESPAEIDVTAGRVKIEMPASVESEPVTFTFTNDFGKDVFVAFAKLNQGVSPAKLDAAFKKSPDAAFPLITVAGGFSHAKPGDVQTVTMLLPAGTYIAVDPEAGPALKPAYFEVTPAAGPDVAEPDANGTIEAGDFYFEIGEIAAGGGDVLVENVGEQGHEVVLLNVSGKKEKEAGFYFAPPPGGKMWVPLDLEAGEYRAVCYFPDPKSGKPHVKLGMETEFTVR